MSLARQSATELVNALCSFEEDERGCCLYHESIVDVYLSLQGVFCPFTCLEVLLLARCTSKNSSRCIILRWIYKFEVLESFAVTIDGNYSVGVSTQCGQPLLSVSNPKYFHTKALVFFFDTSVSPCTLLLQNLHYNRLQVPS